MHKWNKREQEKNQFEQNKKKKINNDLWIYCAIDIVNKHGYSLRFWLSSSNIVLCMDKPSSQYSQARDFVNEEHSAKVLQRWKTEVEI